jgi:N-acetylmuramic acid 6-phosphate etherase
MPGTEDNNIFSRNIDQWSTLEIASFIHLSDSFALHSIYSQLENIALVIDSCRERIENGGRVIYAGAGTSGRIAVQDVAELKPTYGLGKETFDYIIAGGDEAIRHSVEGAEDSGEAAAIALAGKRFGPKDVLIGITASGSTPYVIGALNYARSLKGLTVAITNNKDKPVKAASDICLEVLSGPEVIQGSTRMKAGTSQKMILNIISTGIVIKLGYTYKNTMMKMESWYNEKLKLRAINMLVQEFRISNDEAKTILEKYSYRIDDAFRHFNSEKR